MKAITLHQPYATLIALGIKRIETRSWPTSYRGALAIHAGKQCDDEAVTYFAEEMGYADLPSGVVVATANLVNVVPTVSREWIPIFEDQFEYGDFIPGRFAWILDDVQPLPIPVPARGKQGLWNWTQEGE